MDYLMEMFAWFFQEALYLCLGRKFFGEKFAHERHKIPKRKRAILFLISLIVGVAAIFFVVTISLWFKR